MNNEQQLAQEGQENWRAPEVSGVDSGAKSTENRGMAALKSVEWKKDVKLTSAEIAALRQKVRDSGIPSERYGNFLAAQLREGPVDPQAKLVARNADEPMFVAGEYLAVPGDGGQTKNFEVVDPTPDAGGNIKVKELSITEDGEVKWTEKDMSETELTSPSPRLRTIN